MAFIENFRKGKAYRVRTGTDQATGRYVYDKLSFITAAEDVLFDNDTKLSDIQGEFMYAEGTLIQGQTEVTVTGSNITADGMLDIYVPIEKCQMTPSEIKNQTNGSVTLVFAAQDTDVTIRVVCKNLSHA